VSALIRGWWRITTKDIRDDHQPARPLRRNLVRELERIVNGMANKESYLDRDHKAKARAEGEWRVVSLSDRPKLGGVRSGIAYDPKTDAYFVVCHASVSVAPRPLPVVQAGA
jgi:hypothetical protein